MAKQTLYEILGVAGDASGEDIQRAFEDRRKELGDETGSEDGRNQLSFLDHAREVLVDPRRRAAYDRRNRTSPTDEEARPAPRRRSRYPFVMVLVLVAGILFARQYLFKAGSVAPKEQVAAVKSPEKPVVVDQLPSVEEAGAALASLNAAPESGATPLPAAPVASPAAVPSPPVARVVVGVQGSPLMNKILESTYAIVGSQGLGTGVAVEADRLLTNCHVIAPNVLKGKIYAISPVTGASFEITEAAFLVREDACVVHAPGLAASPIPLGDTARLQRGAHFHNIGFGDGKLTLADGLYLGNLLRFGQYYMLSTNYCIPGVSGGPLVDDDGRLVGLTSGGARDSRGNNLCASLTVETARTVLAERMMQIDAFPTNYLTNWTGRR